MSPFSCKMPSLFLQNSPFYMLLLLLVWTLPTMNTAQSFNLTTNQNPSTSNPNNLTKLKPKKKCHLWCTTKIMAYSFGTGVIAMMLLRKYPSNFQNMLNSIGQSITEYSNNIVPSTRFFLK